MRHAPILTLAATVVLLGGRLLAQDKPDFSGTWVYDTAHSSKTMKVMRATSDGRWDVVDLEMPPPPVLGNEFTATQDARTLTIRRSRTQQTSLVEVRNGIRIDHSPPGGAVEYSLVYALDGSESRNSVPATLASEPAVLSISVATWNGATLEIRPKFSTTGGPPPPGMRAFHLDDTGSLVIETTSVIGGEPSKITTTYTKKGKGGSD